MIMANLFRIVKKNDGQVKRNNLSSPTSEAGLIYNCTLITHCTILVNYP